ncbi:PREDICTED: cystatin-A [Ficedula albicollis]|uniref:Cystatin A n=1 Tax=Ficedula albicollis TaxID=59894 RepID=A0A803VVE0_FICAL|nr:PREDICTED: cystatin-A [Ficedula albicollis]
MCVYICEVPGDSAQTAELPSSEPLIISEKSLATMMPGGLSDTKPATPDVQQLVNQVKPQFESRANVNCAVFTAIVYKTQVVAGTMYFIKVQVSDGDYVHLKVFQSLPYENQGPSLVSFQTGKTRDDPLTYF